MDRAYIAIDLKSFYASVECVERKLDPLTARLVVADESRTEKTICLAVSPALKELGIPGRPRLFEVVQRAGELGGIDYLVARPRMALYMAYSTKIYSIYLRYVAPEDIFAYSVDEVFIDVTSYLHIYDTTPHELALKMIRTVLEETGIHINIRPDFVTRSQYTIQGKVEKNVNIFLAGTSDTQTVIQKEEIEDYVWLGYDKAMARLRFENDRNILRRAYEYLKSNNIITESKNGVLNSVTR